MDSVPTNELRIEAHQTKLVQGRRTVHNNRALLHDPQHVLLSLRIPFLNHLQGLHCRIPGTDQLPAYKRSKYIPGHLLGQPYLVQLKPTVRYYNTAPNCVHNSTEHLALERRELRHIAEGPLNKPFNRLRLQLLVLWLVDPYQLVPLLIQVSTGPLLEAVWEVLGIAQVITCVQQLCIQIVAVCYHGQPAV